MAPQHGGVQDDNVWFGLLHLDQCASRIRCVLYLQPGGSQIFGNPEACDDIAVNQLNAQHSLQVVGKQSAGLEHRNLLLLSDLWGGGHGGPTIGT